MLKPMTYTSEVQCVPEQQVTPQPPQFRSSLYQATQAPRQQMPATWATPASVCTAHGAPSGRPEQLAATQATQVERAQVAGVATKPAGQVGVDW
jgi:hypothetical protein